MVEEKRANGLTRRTLVRVGAGTALTASLPWRALAQSVPPGPGPNFNPAAKYAVVDRMTYGQNEQERKLFDNLGWDAYVDYHLNPNAIDDTYCDNRMIEYEALKMTPKQVKSSYSGSSYDAVSEVIEAQIVRARYSNRQLLEMMVEFWSDHFNVFAYGEQWWETFPSHMATIRKYALSNFPTLLAQMARSGAMLGYLDNVDNRITGGNENYAREILELHTMGADNGYTETDMETVRKCLTGWNINYDDKDSNWAMFKFYGEMHARGGGMFLGELIDRGGQEQGDTILMKLAAHPSTASHIAEKLCRRFLGDDVKPATVDKVAKIYLSSGGDVKAMLKACLKSGKFIPLASTKYKRPFKYLMSAIRATNGQITEGWALRWGYLTQMRQVPFEWAPPNGYPDHIAAWVDNIRPRWQFAQDMVMANAWGVYCDIFGQLNDRTRAGVVNYCDRAFFGASLPNPRKDLLGQYVPQHLSNSQIREVIGRALSMPECQYC
ncbi:hypothetical protein BH11ARM2_BH11ARM2_30030 [soil metagenome]